MAKDQVAELESQIAGGRREISSEGYSMSIGELTNLYREGELVIRPAFQRLFRWEDVQKSRLIESILLGIPLPSIFVSQDQDGRWELVDGLQRVSTLLQLQGVLETDGQRVPALRMCGTRYLPSLDGILWDDPDGGPSLSNAQQLDIKRAKIDVKIIKRESSPQARYDLFQRLNSFGSQATPQEIRSALIVSVNPSFQEWIEAAAKSSNFAETTNLSDREISEQVDLELVLRFLILHNRRDVSQASLRRRGELIDDESVALAEGFETKKDEIERVFSTTFDAVAAGGRDVFRKWDPAAGKFVRGFLNTAYEVVAMGIGFHVAGGTDFRLDVVEAAKELWEREDMSSGFATGLATEVRLARMLPLGRELMAA